MDIIWAVSRYILPSITVIILIKCILTLMLGHPKEKIYGYIIDMKSGNRYALNMWETSVGRSKSCDVVLPYDTVARSHAVITRRIDGWYIHDLLTKARLTVNGEDVEQKALIKNGDIIYFGKHRFRFEVADDPVQNVGKKKKGGKAKAQPEEIKKAPPAKGSYDNNRHKKLNRHRKHLLTTAKPINLSFTLKKHVPYRLPFTAVTAMFTVLKPPPVSSSLPDADRKNSPVL